MRVPYLSSEFLAGIPLKRREVPRASVRPPVPAVPDGRARIEMEPFLPSQRFTGTNGKAPAVVVDAEEAFDEEMRRRWRFVVRLLVLNLVLTVVCAATVFFLLDAQLESLRRIMAHR